MLHAIERKSRTAFARLIIVPVLFLVLQTALVYADELQDTATILNPGKTAPLCVLKNLEDQLIEFPVLNEWNLIFFWSLFCHSCLEEIPALVNELTESEFSSCKSFFVSLDTEKKKTAIANFIMRRNLNCNVLLEEITKEDEQKYKSADLWGVKMTPASFLISPEGKIVFSREGPFDPDELFSLLRNSMQRKDVENDNSEVTCPAHSTEVK